MVDERLRDMGMILKPTSGGFSHNHMATQKAVGNYIGGHTHSSSMLMQHDASYILYYFERDLRIHLAKNRHGGTGDLSIDQFLDFALQCSTNIRQ